MTRQEIDRRFEIMADLIVEHGMALVQAARRAMLPITLAESRWQQLCRKMGERPSADGDVVAPVREGARDGIR